MSEWCQIENGYLTVQLTTEGAEMKRLFHRAWNRELLWSGDDKIWPRSSPILFPIIGKLINNEYIYQDKHYTLPQHGFARDMTFKMVHADVHECEFLLISSKDTFATYPFLFELRVGYSLEETKLTINYSVKNVDRQDIYFSIGGHPGFATPIIDEYNIIFEKEEESYYLTKNNQLDVTKKIKFKGKNLILSKNIFKNDALIFKELKSGYVDLINNVKKQGIRLSSNYFNYLGIWGKGDVPFVCLEPWCGVTDVVGHDKQFSKKEGIVKLQEGNEFVFSYSIEMFHL
jgi:galactose mutarotase-like enzyme